MMTQESPPPWVQPKFLIAAVLVITLVVVGVALALSGRDDPEGTATTSPATVVASTPATPLADVGVESVCGLPGYTDSGTLTAAPTAEWLFQGTTAYPTSSEYGPGATSPEGVRYCFQHTPTGALFAAANAIVQGSFVETSVPWIEYFLSAQTTNRDQLVDDTPAGTSTETRMHIVGFRVLAYDGKTARIDMAVRAIGGGNTVYGSAAYDLVWEDGDWKLLPLDVSNPLRLAQIPDTSGYIAWEE